MEGFVRKAGVLRARNVLPGQVKPIGFAGGEGVKLLFSRTICQHDRVGWRGRSV